MALSFTVLTSGSSPTDGTVFTTASVTPGANKLILVVDTSRAGTIGAQPTVTGNGLTWVQVGSVSFGGTRRASISRSMGASPSAGAVTITYPIGQDFAVWAVIEVDGVPTTGTNGSDAIIGSAVTDANNPFTTASLTLPALGSANNAAFGVFAHAVNQLKTPGSGFTELVDLTLSDGVGVGFQIEHKLNTTTVDASWASSTAYWALAIEIAAAAAGGSAKPFRYYQRMQQFQRQIFERRRSGIYVPATTFAKVA